MLAALCVKNDEELRTISTGYGLEVEVEVEDMGDSIIRFPIQTDDFTIDTTNGVEQRNIFPACLQCRNLCTFSRLDSQRERGCSAGKKCRSLKPHKYKFTCKDCSISICLPCSMALGSIYAVDKILNTCNRLTPLTGNNGKFQVH